MMMSAAHPGRGAGSALPGRGGQRMLFVMQDAGIRFAIVEDQEQVDKLLEIMAQVGTLEHIIYDDARDAALHATFLHDIQN